MLNALIYISGSNARAPSHCIQGRGETKRGGVALLSELACGQQHRLCRVAVLVF